MLKQKGYKIEPDEKVTPAGEDILRYWDQGTYNNMTFGRFLSGTKQGAASPVHFWIGLDMKWHNVAFIIWFLKTNMTQVQIKKLEQLCQKYFMQIQPYNTEIWIPFPDNDFQDFCDTKNLQKLTDFLDDILSNL
jgi:hypothetical protein